VTPQSTLNRSVRTSGSLRSRVDLLIQPPSGIEHFVGVCTANGACQKRPHSILTLVVLPPCLVAVVKINDCIHEREGREAVRQGQALEAGPHKSAQGAGQPGHLLKDGRLHFEPGGGVLGGLGPVGEGLQAQLVGQGEDVAVGVPETWGLRRREGEVGKKL
jgi:hypothetical protein